MKRLSRLAIALAGALALAGCYMGPARAQPGPPPLADPCITGPCQLYGAAVRLTIPLPMAGHFAGKFELVPLFSRSLPVIRNGHQYEALRNTISFRRPNGELLVMPAGMRTDLASIPRVFWPVLPPDGPYGEGTIPHDLCYRSQGTFEYFGHVWRTRTAPYSRAECDQILDEGMVALGVPAWKRIVIYSAVRVGGAGGFGS